MKNQFSLATFLRKYKDDESCLAEIFKIKYPKGAKCQNKKCKYFEQISNFYKIKGRMVYQCSCGYQIAPLAGTIFEKTTTPLQYWFYAMFVMSNTRSGVSAKQLQRELAVSYKTAWRMFKQIRMLMAEPKDGLLDGIVEVDETFVGGKTSNRKNKYGIGSTDKEIVMGMLKRGGKVYLKHIPNTGKWTLLQQIKENVDPTARVFTDEFAGYYHLPKFGYYHESVNHRLESVRGEVHTQGIENFWSHFKRGVTGVYRVVSKKYLQAYVDEYGFRFNHRNEPMFELLMNQIAETKLIKTKNPS